MGARGQFGPALPALFRGVALWQAKPHVALRCCSPGRSVFQRIILQGQKAGGRYR